MDIAHRLTDWTLSELDHSYGSHVHILDDPCYATQLAALCSPECGQPRFNRLVRRLYEGLCRAVINNEFPRSRRRIPTRMSATTERGVVGADFIDPNTQVVTVDLARAGILPSMTIFESLHELLDPRGIRQDHIIMQRQTDADGQVIGAEMSGSKVGGPVDGRVVLIPDPMGATGSSMCNAIRYYTSGLGGCPGPIIAMHLIVTPEYIKRVTQEFPDTRIYALRLDRGMSSEAVLNVRPGERWDEEMGLNGHQYIVPGGGGFGELMNNALV
ncbi:MAG: uracil phosphoribosyltransferase [Myxococcota bacterium]|nr:uracil phosphoribosyltransferase [Myxococcota bacterium]